MDSNPIVAVDIKALSEQRQQKVKRMRAMLKRPIYARKGKKGWGGAGIIAIHAANPGTPNYAQLEASLIRAGYALVVGK